MTIKNFATSELLEKKSKFICFVSPVSDEQNAKDFINKYKKEYPDATHIIPVYAVSENKKTKYYFSDAGEPSKTAGYPILSIIEKKQLINIVCVVLRYFGGIKLGTGGLVRAYSATFLKTLSNATIVPYVENITILLLFNDFSLQKTIETILRNYNGSIINKKYAAEIEYKVTIQIKFLEIIQNELDHLKVTVKIAP